MTDPDGQDFELKLKSYIILSELAGAHAVPGPAKLARVYLSSIALVAHLELDLPNVATGHPPSAIEGGHDALMSQVRRLMRLLLQRLNEHGVDCPGVALLSPREGSAMLTQGAVEEFRRIYRPLQANQDWHRGEFLVFVEVGQGEKGNNSVKSRLIDLLSPEPPQVNIPVGSQSLKDVIDKLAKTENPLLSKLLDGWRRALEEGRKTRLLGLQLDELCVRDGDAAILAVVKPALDDADRLLEEVR